MGLKHFLKAFLCGQKPRCPTVEVFRLRQELERKQRDINYLEFRLTQTRADKFELEQRPAELRGIIAEILNEPMEQLGRAARFHVREAEPGPGWEVVTDHCCLGGCDMNVYTFQSERDALLFARLLKAVGYRPPHNIACPACYYVLVKEGKAAPDDAFAYAHYEDRVISFYPFDFNACQPRFWDMAFSFDTDLFFFLERGYELAGMSLLAHRVAWEEITEYHACDYFEYPRGMQRYLRYCKQNGITVDLLRKDHQYDGMDVLALYNQSGL